MDIPGLTLVRQTTSSAPACVTYEPSLAVIAQGRKRVDLGRTTFIYDESRFLLTSLDLPIVSQVIGASEGTPFLALALKTRAPVPGLLRRRGEKDLGPLHAAHVNCVDNVTKRRRAIRLQVRRISLFRPDHA